MFARECILSIWILFFLPEFVCKKEVLEIINSAKIGLVSYLHVLPEAILVLPKRS